MSNDVPVSPIEGSNDEQPRLSAMSRFATVPWQFRDVVIGLLPLAIYRTWVSFVDDSIGTVGQWLLTALLIVIVLWALVFPLIIARRRCPAWSWRPPSFGRMLIEAAWAVPLTIATIALSVAVAYALVWTGGEDYATTDVFESARQATSLPGLYVLWLILACTLGPISEEVFTRGFLQNALKAWLPSAAALAAQAVIFAALHPQPFANVVVIFFIGLFLGLIYEWRKTLLAPMFVHVGVNTTIIGLLLITVAMNEPGPLLGVTCADRKPEPGCTISVLAPESAAEQAGLQVGDVIVGIDGEGVANFRHLTQMIRARAIGQEVTVKFYRDGDLLETRAVLKKRD
jgi:membrane protease YdiL (CAAX protease family)